MNSTAPAADRSRPKPEPRRASAATAPAPEPHGAICTPVPPPLLRIPFPAIHFEWAGARYHTQPMELVAAVEGRMQNAECRMAESPSASPSLTPPSPAPSSILPSRSSPLPLPSSSILHSSFCTLHSLTKGLGVWHLIFEGHEAVLRHERGLLYVAWLLQHPPPQPLHAVDLAAQIPELYRVQLGLAALADPATGRSTALASHARLQERSLALDDAQSLRALRRKEQELEAILDDDSQCEPVKAEALRELETLVQFQRDHGHRSRDTAQRVVDTVRKAIRRLHANLAAAVDVHGAPHSVLRAFAAHLEQHLLLPSGRGASRGGRYLRSAGAGCFIYEPPPGVVWGP